MYGQKLTNREKKILNDTFDVSRIYIAEVMDTRNIARNGEIKVWLLNSNLERENPENWYTAKYSSPFYGVTQFKTNLDEYNKTPTSFGMWFGMPYVGNYVAVYFAVVQGGKVNPYWFSCPVDDYYNKSIVGLAKDITGKTKNTSECENNIQDKSERRVEYKPLAEALKKQGLDEDLLRGPSTSTPKREAPSMVYGISTPLGNQFIMDDGWSIDDSKLNWNEDVTLDARLQIKDNKTHDKQDWTSNLLESEKEDKFKRFNGGFRFRTRNGTQLLILDSGQIYIINKDGSAWTEWSDDGNIDVYSDKSVNVRSGKDINLKADGNINLEAGKSIQMKAEGRIVEESNATIDLISGTTNIKGSTYIGSLSTPNAIVDNLISVNASLTGSFKGTLDGIAKMAVTSTQMMTEFIPVSTEKSTTPDIASIPINSVAGMGKTAQSTITTRAPTHEPYGGHDKNNCFPNINTKRKNDEVKTSSSKTITNSV